MKITKLIPLYLKELSILNRRPGTIATIKNDLAILVRFLEEEKADKVEDLTADLLADYQQELSFRLTAKGTPLTIGSQLRLLCAVRGLTRFLKDKDYLVTDPGAKLRLPKTTKRLPKVILSPKEIKTLVNAQDTRTRYGYRRRLIIEVLYDTGIRRSELAALRTMDIDHSAGYLHIRNGKGGKDRVVPVGNRVCKLIHNYMLFIRPTFIGDKDPGGLIVTRFGQNMAAHGIYWEVRQAVKKSGIKKNITTHSLRHSCATHMLKNGAPVRHIQEMLGHASLDSTQIYTRVTINDLKQIHAKYHPGENMTHR
jgi:integrase/recombinase XerD